MNTVWRSNSRRLFLGGCGSQVGLAIGFIALGSILLVCGVCAGTNALAIVIAQQVAQPAAPMIVSAEPNAEAQSLQQEIDALVAEVEVLRAADPAAPAPAAAPAPVPAPASKPIAIAHQGTANLRGGPGVQYNRLGSMAQGDSLEVVGRNPDASWWLVACPNGLAWVSAEVVMTYGPTEDLPVLSIPALLAWPGAGPSNMPSAPAPAGPPGSAAPADPLPALPSGTPTPTAAESRIFVEDTEGYRKLRQQLSYPPTSATFSPQGDRIAVIEGIKLYIVAADGSYGQTLLEEDETLKPVGQAAWSPDGKYLAFAVKYRKQNCPPCLGIGLARIADGSITFLQTPPGLGGDTPRWTQDGRLLVNAHPGEPADGATYLYDLSGRGQAATDVYALSSSHDGQRWFPWRPGRVWRSAVSERPDAYYGD